MIQFLKKLDADQKFLIAAFVLSLLLSFAFAYTVFRYWRLDVCKSGLTALYNGETVFAVGSGANDGVSSVSGK